MSKKFSVMLVVMLTLLLMAVSVSVFHFYSVKATPGTIYILPDGSVDPPTANITSTDNVTYYFTDNNYDEIEVLRSNIIVDGNGYTLQGFAHNGFSVIEIGVNNVTIRNTNIKDFFWGVFFYSSSNNTVSGNNITTTVNVGVILYLCSNNTVSGNNITNNEHGVGLDSCSFSSVSGNNITNNEYGVSLAGPYSNTVSGNNITNNYYGISLWEALDNTVYHNNFINNTEQVYDHSWDNPEAAPSVNTWDNGYPSGGNYWSNYTGVDFYSGSNQDQPGSDGIGDTPYSIDENNADNYPLMNPFYEPPTVISGWLTFSVTFDGQVTTVEEWSDTTPVDATLLEWGVGPGTASARVWIKNDDTWLYMLYRVQWPDPDPLDAGFIAYYWDWIGEPPPLWSHSDCGGVGFEWTGDFYGWDEYSWHDDTEASPLGENNVEGAATHDGTYYWFEFRKELDSGDSYDWAFTPGQIIQTVTGVTELHVALYDATIDGPYQADISLHLSTPPPAPQDLELYPREVVDLEDPTGTQWHELHPDKGNYYHLTDWEPGMVLSPTDGIDMESLDPPFIDSFLVEDVTIDIVVFDELEGIFRELHYECGYWTFKQDVWENPVSSKWIEIKNSFGPVVPQICWHLTNWTDDGDGKLSFCDLIEMTAMYPYPEPLRPCHVEFVTVTLKLLSAFDSLQHYIEWEGPLEEFQAMDHIHSPEGTMWHEILPNQDQTWQLVFWWESFMLSPSDKIVLTLKDEFGVPIPGSDAEYHVDKLTVAMNLTSMIDEREHIVKFEGSLTQFMEYDWVDPVSTQWHEVNPNYCRQWHLTYWEDTNINGILDSFDLIEMIDKETGEPEEFHVESLSTDIIVTKKPKVHDVTVIDVTPSKTVVGQGCCMNITVTVENQGDFPESFNVTAYYSNETLTPEQWEIFWSWGDVNRDGYIDDIDGDLIDAAMDSIPGTPYWNPDADLDQDGDVDWDDLFWWLLHIGWDIWTEFNIIGGSIGRHTVNSLSPGNSATLVFTWNTTGVPYGNYIISSKATRIIGETDVEDNILVDGTVFVTIIGDVDGDGSVDASDLRDLTEAYGSKPGDANWNPNCDLNNDGKIDASDLFDLCKNYGQTI